MRGVRAPVPASDRSTSCSSWPCYSPRLHTWDHRDTEQQVYLSTGSWCTRGEMPAVPRTPLASISSPPYHSGSSGRPVASWLAWLLRCRRNRWCHVLPWRTVGRWRSLASLHHSRETHHAYLPEVLVSIPRSHPHQSPLRRKRWSEVWPEPLRDARCHLWDSSNSPWR